MNEPFDMPCNPVILQYDAAMSQQAVMSQRLYQNQPVKSLLSAHTVTHAENMIGIEIILGKITGLANLQILGDPLQFAHIAS